MKKILIFLTALFILAGCEDRLLNLAPTSEVTTANFYQSESDMNSALIAAYGALQGLNNDINWKFQEIRSDNAYPDQSAATAYDIDNFNVAETENNLADLWQMSYNGIFRCNVILDKIDGVDMLQERKDLIIGQAKFIRALVYFDLVRTFGAVPKVTTVLALSEAPEVPRASVDEIYQLIVSDLSDAASLLPLVYESSADIGRAAQGAANGLLGKVYLTRGDYTNAGIALDKVIAHEGDVYELLPNYSDVFDITNSNNKEILFAIQYSNGTGNGNSFIYTYAGMTGGNDVNPGTGLGMCRPTAELIRAFEDGDARFDVTLRPYEANPNTGDTLLNKAYYRKFLADQLIQDGGQDFPILRYADILLMKAEVILAGNASTSDAAALASVNRVRARAGMPDLVAPLTADQLLHERRVELGCENHRWFDLLRFGRAEEFLDVEIRQENYNTGVDLITYPTDMQEYQRLFPIPLEELELHTGWQQNPEY